jgi:2,4-dienoyl-CoA reductase-like NADH-dependent reductase (Old Yellow Enzyme family)
MSVNSLFEKVGLGTITVPNRFVRSATWEGMAGDDGSVTDGIIDMYTALAEGGVGLIITGHAYVSKEGQAVPWQLGIYDDGLLKGLSRLADVVHARDGRIVVQLSHAGCRGAASITGMEPIGPSVMIGDQGQVCREMEADDLSRVARDFASAAARAEAAGFDGVQIHGAHSYLISEFLSPCHNKRSDEYGGTVRKGGDMAKATCLTDNQCLVPLRSGKGPYCVVERAKRTEKAS